jgi:DNA-directed RNA polymerase subunit beta
MPKSVKLGRKERQTFSKINEVAEMPNLIQIQTKSYDWFLKEGLREVFEDISPIQDYAGNLVLEFIDYSLSDPPKYNQEECKDRDATYAAPLKVKVRLITNATGEIKEQEVFMGDFPLMTEKGTFIYNGAERVVVTQLVRSPGPYYEKSIDKEGKELYAATVIPNRGAWLEYETDSNEVLSVRVDRTRKQPITTLVRALQQFIPDEQERYGNHADLSLETNDDILALFGEEDRLLRTLEKDKDVETSSDALKEIYKKLRPGEPPTDESAYSLIHSLFFDPKRYDIAKVGRYKYNKKLGLANRIEDTIVAEDRRHRSPGQPAPAQRGRAAAEPDPRGAFALERVVRERMSIQDMDVATPSNLINIRPVTAAIKEFFGSSQLSQFMDQTNPLAELTHKRRFRRWARAASTASAPFEVRDVHHSHYGRMCPIETPEGPNIGLILSSTYARINEYGFIEIAVPRLTRRKKW